MRLPRFTKMPDNGQLMWGFGSFAAAGTSQATGTQLTAQLNYVTAADGTKGVVLPSALKGMHVYVLNSSTASVLKVYPFAGDAAAINALSADAALSLGPGRSATFLAASKTQWYVPDTSAGNTVVGAMTFLTGGDITPPTTPTGVPNWQPVAATSGTDTAPANGTQFVTSLFLPFTKLITNINFLIGSVGGTDKVYGVLYDSTGAVLANTSLVNGGATVGTAANLQTLALTATYTAKGPGRYFVGISANGNTSRFRSVPAFTQAGLWAGQVAQVHGTVAAIAPPATFTADKGPVVFLD